MSIITVDNDEIYAISASQSPGAISPAITAKIMPAINGINADLLDYTAPDLLISIGGITFDCSPQNVSVDIDPEEFGVDVEVQYYPKVLMTLRQGGLKKSLVFISCEEYQQTLLEGEYDEERFEVLFKNCDVYVSNGWTIEEIMKEIASRAGLTIKYAIPAFHVPNSTVVFQRGQKFLDFIRGLLPQNFEYVWNLNGSTLTLSMVQSSKSKMSFIPGTFRTAAARQALPPYDFIEITGGIYKYGHIINLGEATKLGSSTYYDNGKIVDRNMPEETVETEEGIETKAVTIQYKTGPDGVEMFGILERTTQVTGPYPDSYGTTSQKLLRETVETFTYENDDVMEFLQPRKVQVDTTVSSYHTRLTGSALRSTQSYWLTDDSRVLTPSQYDAIDEEDQPSVLLCAYQVYAESETSTETWAYIQKSEADHNWYEGMQTSNTLSVSHKFCLINGIYYDSNLAPKELLQTALGDIATTGDLSITSYSSNITKEGSVVSRSISLISEGSYQFEESTKLFDTKAGGMTIQPVNRQIIDSGQIPSSPSKYRTAPLHVTLDTIDGEGSRSLGNGLGGNDVCFPLILSIQTNNPNDFEAWAGMLMEQVLYEQKDASVVSFERIFRVGDIAGGVTITSFQVSQTESGQAVTMGGVA